ncbi:MAG: serine protease Do [Thermoleophilaceae bacterium]|nr:serine protease Do [Thermoleophilaceae bacterium]
MSTVDTPPSPWSRSGFPDSGDETDPVDTYPADPDPTVPFTPPPVHPRATPSSFSTSSYPTPPPSAPPAGGRPRTRVWVAAAAALALVAGLVGGVVGANLASDETQVTASGTPNPSNGISSDAVNPALAGPALDVAGILDKVEPAVVAIQASGRLGTGQGTGIVISADGEVLTNAHVVEGATQIRVTLQGQSQSRPATLVGADSGNDIALLKITDASGLAIAELGSSANVRVGDDVVAIGNALGLRGDPTVTRGIVSALNRSLDTLTGMIQTDAAINPGNSGGPLSNSSGQVIGINTAVAGRGGQNIGFAIPIDSARTILDRLRSGQAAKPVGYLGVSTRDPDDNSRGAQIVDLVAGGPAERGGIEIGDLITDVDGREVIGSDGLVGVLRELAPGTKVSVTVERDGKSQKISVTLGERPAN